MDTAATCSENQPAASSTSAAEDSILETPLRWLVGHKPGLFHLDRITAEAQDQKVDVRVADLWGQLSRGKIMTTYALLIVNIPAEYVRDDAAPASDELVDLPLNEIVGALDPAALDQMRPAGQATLVDDMPDLFQFAPPSKPAPKSEAPEVVPTPPEAVAEPQRPEAPEIVPTSPEAVAEPQRPEAELAPHEVPDLFEFAAPQTMIAPPEAPSAPAGAVAKPVAAHGSRSLFLQEVDLNAASIEELVAKVKGLNHHLAHQIVLSRKRDGLYLTLHDLARVSGIGPAALRRLTGLDWPGTISRDRTAAVALLGLTESTELSFPTVVQRFRDLKGFDGCMIVNSDGETLAESWGDSASEALAAFVSHTMKRMTPHIRSMGVAGADFMTVSLEGRAFTMVQVHKMTFIAVHEAGRFSQRQVRFVQQVGQLLRDALIG